MIKRFGLAGVLVSAFILGNTADNANAENPAGNLCRCSANSVSQKRSVFCYEINSCRNYNVTFNNNSFCRFPKDSKIQKGDSEISFSARDLKTGEVCYSIFKLSSFLNLNLEYDVRIVGADGKERLVDENGIIRGDRALKFYGPVEKNIIDEKTRTFKDADTGDLFRPAVNPSKKPIYYSTIPFYK